MMDRNSQGNRFGEQSEMEEVVVQIKRISKKTKGGNQMRFSALVVVGDRKGKVGVALAKAPDVRNAIKKSFSIARKKMIRIPLSGGTIPCSVVEKFSAAKILLKPAPPGSGVIAGGAMRVVLNAAGVENAVGKIMGTKNKASNVYATLKALKRISLIDSRKNVVKNDKKNSVQGKKIKKVKRKGGKRKKNE